MADKKKQLYYMLVLEREFGMLTIHSPAFKTVREVDDYHHELRRFVPTDHLLEEADMHPDEVEDATVYQKYMTDAEAQTLSEGYKELLEIIELCKEEGRKKYGSD